MAQFPRNLKQREAGASKFSRVRSVKEQSVRAAGGRRPGSIRATPSKFCFKSSCWGDSGGSKSPTLCHLKEAKRVRTLHHPPSPLSTETHPSQGRIIPNRWDSEEKTDSERVTTRLPVQSLPRLPALLRGLPPSLPLSLPLSLSVPLSIEHKHTD